MIYMDKMVNWDWDVKEMRTGRMKIVIQEAAVLAKRKGTEKLTVPNQGSGEEYTRRVLEFLEGIREEKMRKEKEEQTKIEWNVSAGAFHPREEKGEKKNQERMKEGGIELYPKGGLMVINETNLMKPI